MAVGDITMADCASDAKDPLETPQVVVEAEQMEKVSIWKKLAYHLWDADQHLKSPEVSEPKIG